MLGPTWLRWTLLLGLTSSVRASDCNYVILVKCFIEVLDEWAWTLYESQDNVVTISDDGCSHFNRISSCINDQGPAGQHLCSAAEIMETSRTVSDLLTHRKHSGSFLKSYYLLHYACTDGREEVIKHRECLKTEAIGEQTLSAAGYLEEKFKEAQVETSEDACAILTDKLIAFRKIIAQQNLCGGEAEKLMCESLKRMFINVEAEKLGDCAFDCSTPDGLPKVVNAPTEESVPSEETVSEAGKALGVNGNGATAGSAAVFQSLLSHILLIVSTLLLLSPLL